jgi:hypothetical protein
MCIISVKRPGFALPNQATINQMWDANEDGAGFMYQRNGTGEIHIHKGLMTLKAFNKALKEAAITDQDMLVMHFRITTSGGTCKEMTHPFVASNKRNVITASKVTLKKGVAFAHNGIITELNGIDRDNSDTALFAMNILSKLGDSIMTNDAVQELVASYINSSRMVFLHQSHPMVKVGNWVEDDGILYSNSTYKKVVYNYARDWDWDNRSYGYGYGYGKKNNKSTKTTNLPTTSEWQKMQDTCNKAYDGCFHPTLELGKGESVIAINGKVYFGYESRALNGYTWGAATKSYAAYIKDFLEKMLENYDESVEKLLEDYFDLESEHAGQNIQDLLIWFIQVATNDKCTWYDAQKEIVEIANQIKSKTNNL